MHTTILAYSISSPHQSLPPPPRVLGTQGPLSNDLHTLLQGIVVSALPTDPPPSNARGHCQCDLKARYVPD